MSVSRAQFAVPVVLMTVGLAVVLAIPDTTIADARCDVPPRTFEDISRMIDSGRSPERGAASPEAGSPTRAATAEDIRAVLSRFVACSGAGEPLRVWSLYTDAYLSRLLSRERGYDRIRYDLDAEPSPLVSSDWPHLVALDGGSVDATGRIVADATIFYPNLERTKQLRFWIVWTDGELRIDEVDGEITFAVP